MVQKLLSHPLREGSAFERIMAKRMKLEAPSATADLLFRPIPRFE